VKNTGKSDAYVRTLFAFEQGSVKAEDFENVIMTNTNQDHWAWEVVASDVEINDNTYVVWCATYLGPKSNPTSVLAAGTTSYASLLQVYMKPEATNEEVEKIDGNKNGTYDILVLSQAVQTEGFTSAKQAQGIEDVRRVLKNKISVFSGNSGVGKSSIINALFGRDKTQEGEISQKNKKCKNTTTDTKLYELEENTYIADTPGFSSFEISEIESTELDQYFREFKQEVSNCEFVGCTHIKEECCGIKNAIEAGRISQERYERFCKIYEELKDKEKHKW